MECSDDVFAFISLILCPVCIHHRVDAECGVRKVDDGDNRCHHVLKDALISDGALRCFFEAVGQSFVSFRGHKVARHIGEVVVKVW